MSEQRVVELDVPVLMRDRITLRANVYRPPEVRWPVGGIRSKPKRPTPGPTRCRHVAAHWVMAPEFPSGPPPDRNTNTGRPIGADGPEGLRTATQSILHVAEQASRVVLPVVR